MASWLKAAEDLFEVVDRRAKLVVTELSDEQSDSHLPASNGQESQVKKIKSKVKAQKLLSLNEQYKSSDTAPKPTSTQTRQLANTPNKGRALLSLENGDTGLNDSITQTGDVQLKIVDKDASTPGISSAGAIVNNDGKHDPDHHTEPPVTDITPEVIALTSAGDLFDENASKIQEGFMSLPYSPSDDVVINEDHPLVATESNKMEDADVPLKIDQEKNELVVVDAPNNNDAQVRDANLEMEFPSNQNNQQDRKSDNSSIIVQEQLDEAQGLLKSAISTGPSKEARLARVCAGLSSRLQEYKLENAQLEELLTAERELCKSNEGRIKHLQQQLSASKVELTKAESNMAEALSAKNSEIEALVHSMDGLKKQAAFSEGNMASLQANMDSIMRNRELTETRMMQALREELASAERRAEEEHAAHNATKMAAMEREVELEHRAVESSTALARIQRIADDRTAKAVELEQKVALLEVECASLNQEMQDLEARTRRGQKKSAEEANQIIQMQAWQEEVERARQGQRDAENKLSSLEAELQKMRVEMAAMKRDAEHYSRQEHMELEKRYRELTDLLYYKQTQLEAMSSEKAAAEFQLEKEVKRLQEVQVEAERSRVSRRTSTSWEEDTDLKALEPLPLHHRHMVTASMQLQKAAKLLDSGAVRATRFLWRYPTARVILLFYLVFVHLFLMYLLHRLQEQADSFANREVAESMGLATPTLP